MTDPPPSPPPSFETPLPPAAAPEPGARSDPFSLTLTGVHVLASNGDGQLAVPGMWLVLDQIGVTVLKPDGKVGAVLPWAELVRVTAVERARAPVGGQALVIEAATESRTHRFLVPTDDPGELAAVVAEVVAARTGPTTRQGRDRRRRRRIAAFVVLGTLVIAGVTLALLVTVGGVRL
jgi:hypothetical protein